VASTLGGETLALSQATAEVDWLQVLYRDVMFGDVSREDWRTTLAPFCALMPSQCELAKRCTQTHVIDAKSVYDVISKGSAGNRQDRRTALDLAIVAEALEKASGSIRWVPHAKMPADGLTKAEFLKSNGALEHQMRTGVFALVQEATELQERAGDLALKSRSRAAAQRRLSREPMQC